MIENRERLRSSKPKRATTKTAKAPTLIKAAQKPASKKPRPKSKSPPRLTYSVSQPTAPTIFQKEEKRCFSSPTNSKYRAGQNQVPKHRRFSFNPSKSLAYKFPFFEVRQFAMVLWNGVRVGRRWFHFNGQTSHNSFMNPCYNLAQDRLPTGVIDLSYTSEVQGRFPGLAEPLQSARHPILD